MSPVKPDPSNLNELRFRAAAAQTLRSCSPLLLLIAAIGLASFPAKTDLLAQTPPSAGSARGQSETGDIIRISTNLVQVDVIVTDGKGNHVTDLKPEDFTIKLNGRPQTISYFQPFVLPLAETESGAVALNSGSRSAIAPGPRRLRAEDIRRTMAFVIDDGSIAFDSFVRTREALRKFITSEMQEGDLVSIIQTGRRFNNLSRFTTDRRELLQRIERMSWQPQLGGLVSMNDSAVETVTASPEFNSNYQTLGRISALRYVARSLRDLPGRKMAILLTDGFPVIMGGDDTSPLQLLRIVVDEAHRGGVAFYTVETQGFIVPLPTSTPIEFTPFPLGRPPSNDYQRGQSQRLFNMRQGPIFLARETGGLATVGNNDVLAGIERAVRDNTSYYVLGFDPEDASFDGRYQSLRVEVKRRGLQARSRSGFFGRADTARGNRPKTRNQEVTEAIFSPFAVREVPIEMTALYFAGEERQPLIRVMLQIDATALDFETLENGKLATTLELISVGFGANGQVAEQQERNFTITLDEKAVARAKSEGILYQTDLPVEKPGAYQFHAILREVSSGRMGTAAQAIEIPDLQRSSIALSGLLVAGSGGTIGDDPSRRQFARNSEISYGAILYRGALEASPKLYSQIEIYRDGKVIHQSTPRPIEALSGNELDIGGRLRLNGLQPGDYYLRMVVSDVGTPEKPVRVEGWIDFYIGE